MSITQLPTEQTIGRYKVSARLGRGGMAELFLGRLIGAGGFEKLVAIKRMLPHLSEDPTFVQMFEQEGRIAAELSHPNLCQVYELGESDGQLFLAMEFLRGLPWSEIVPSIPDEPQGPFIRFVVGVLVQACEGLYHAHTAADVDGKPRPIVHRDVSPSNLFLTTEGIVKLLDFGVSKVLTEQQRTRTGMMKGKLPYMAPEQIRNEALDARADLFGLGTVAWEAFAGRALFDRPSDFEIFKAVIEDPIPSLPGDGPVIAALDVAIRRALSRARNDRPASARVFADELRRAMAPLGEPMPPSEIQASVSAWLGPSIARRSRDLADIVGRLRNPDARPSAAIVSPDNPSGEVTSLHTPVEPDGVRLRDQSVVVGGAGRTAPPDDEATTLENVAVTSEVQPVSPAAAAPTLEMPGLAPAPSMEVTAPRDVITPQRDAVVIPRAPVVEAHVSMPDDASGTGQLSPWLPAIIVAVLAIATGMIAALWP